MNNVLKYLVVATIVSFPSVVTANLLVNPSFEPDSSGWTVFGNASHEDRADQDPPTLAGFGDGEFGIALQGWIADGSGGFYQDVSGTNIVEGSNYTFSGNFHQEPGFNPSTYKISLEWWDSSSNLLTETSNDLAGSFSTGLNHSDASEWHFFSVSGTAPINTGIIRALVFFEGTTDIGGLQAARVDNMSLTVSPVPIPAAVWLFGTALIGLVGFNRRKKAA